MQIVQQLSSQDPSVVVQALQLLQSLISGGLNGICKLFVFTFVFLLDISRISTLFTEFDAISPLQAIIASSKDENILQMSLYILGNYCIGTFHYVSFISPVFLVRFNFIRRCQSNTILRYCTDTCADATVTRWSRPSKSFFSSFLLFTIHSSILGSFSSWCML